MLATLSRAVATTLDMVTAHVILRELKEKGFPRADSCHGWCPVRNELSIEGDTLKVTVVYDDLRDGVRYYDFHDFEYEVRDGRFGQLGCDDFLDLADAEDFEACREAVGLSTAYPGC
jgi:hypothetical protein